MLLLHHALVNHGRVVFVEFVMVFVVFSYPVALDLVTLLLSFFGLAFWEVFVLDLVGFLDFVMFIVDLM